MNKRPDRKWELCCGCSHNENKGGSRTRCGYCSCHHRRNDHQFTVVGCTAKQGSLCGHTLEKCPNCEENHIAFSSRWVKKTKATEAARQSRKVWLAGRESQDMATTMGSNRVALGLWAHGVSEGGGDEKKEMADVDEEEEAVGGGQEITRWPKLRLRPGP